MRQKIVMGNWKMNGDVQTITHLLQNFQQNLSAKSVVTCVVLPPFIYLPLVKQQLHTGTIQWGAQNVYPADAGAYTGEISGTMLQESGCSYVLVGHSERRQLFLESEKFIAEKFHYVKDHDMIPVLCVGETLAEREQGREREIISRQLQAMVVKQRTQVFKNCVIAYEPVWAIGTGKTATSEQVQAIHCFIRQWINEYDKSTGDQVPIIYGGSVNAANAHSLFNLPDVDGGLVGGASLNAQQFLEIVKCIN